MQILTGMILTAMALKLQRYINEQKDCTDFLFMIIQTEAVMTAKIFLYPEQKSEYIVAAI